MYLAMSHTPDQLETPGTNPNSRKIHHVVAISSCFFRLCPWPHLGCVCLAFFFVILLSTSWTHHSTDRITSTQQRCPLRARYAPSAHACLFLFHFPCIYLCIFFLSVFFPSLYLVPGTPYGSCEVLDLLLLT